MAYLCSFVLRHWRVQPSEFCDDSTEDFVWFRFPLPLDPGVSDTDAIDVYSHGNLFFASFDQWRVSGIRSESRADLSSGLSCKCSIQTGGHL
jgi:hypothetical protein